MDKMKYYLLFNPELKDLNYILLNKYFEKDKKTNERITSLNSFFKKYPDFNIEIYKKFNKELINKQVIDILVHMHLYGYINQFIYSELSFYKKFPSFNINEFKNTNPQYNNLDKIDILFIWYENTLNENTLKDHTLKDYTLNENTLNENTLKDNTLNENTLKDNTLNENTLKDHTINEKAKLAHIFIHFFEIGGGESYISNFNRYNNLFDETLFINKNYPTKTLFKYDNKIIYYNDYIELNQYLKNFDLILDHQLYWFEEKITLDAFNNLQLNKIIRIIHGVPIHFKDISKFNFYYSIELYTEHLSHESWNNHIKIYNNIGVKKIIIEKNRIFNKNSISVALVGRINNEKIPILFLKNLLIFCKIYKNYKFNFYGLIDETYKNYFLMQINKNEYIIYHGVIMPNLINSVYLENDILLHPSKFEAGATVILEAMAYGLPIIGRNIGGIPHAVGNKNYLCNSEKEMFEKLLSINIENYEIISKNNIIKVNNENNIDIQFTKLINEIEMIYKCENINDKIPNIIHYIFGLDEQKEEFKFVYYLSIYSNYLINKPNIIYFHYQYLPYGYWWDKIKNIVKLNYVNGNNMFWGNKKIVKFAHKADKLRLDILYKYGGIYMDIDTISYKSYQDYLNYDFVIGIQEENYKNENITLYCNAILFSKKNNIFIEKWIKEYENHFIPQGWCEASVHLPSIIFNNLSINEKSNIKILEKECFYYPLYNETEKIFENNLEEINSKLITLHFWNTFSSIYINKILNFEWAQENNSLYSKLMKNIIDIESKLLFNT